MFTRLGVFPADFDLSAAQEVAAAPDGATTALAVRDLVAKSLLVHEPSRGRYRYLETIRLFAREGLEASGELDATTERLRRHVVDRAAGVPRHRRWLSSAGAADSRADIENVRLAFHASLRRGDLTGAVDVALGLSTLWRNAMSFAEGLEWVTALRAARGLSDEDRMWVALLRADLGLGSGRHRIMGEAAAEARELAERLGHPQARLIAAMHQSLLDPDRPRAAETFRVLAGQARELEEPQLKRLLLAFRLVALLLTRGRTGVQEEVDALVRQTDASHDYDRYICLWLAWVAALIARDGARLRSLMDAQVANVRATVCRRLGRGGGARGRAGRSLPGPAGPRHGRQRHHGPGPRPRDPAAAPAGGLRGRPGPGRRPPAAGPAGGPRRLTCEGGVREHPDGAGSVARLAAPGREGRPRVRTTRRRAVRVCVAAAVVLLLGACSGDDPAPPVPDGPTTDEVPAPLEPLPVVDETLLPPWAHGLQRVVAVDVPPDGEWHPLTLPEGTAEPAELAWVLACDPDRRSAGEVREGGDVQLRTAPGDPPTPLSCHPRAPWDGAVRGVLSGPGEGVELRTSHTGPDEVPVRVGIYQPVPWEDYPFAESAAALFAEDPRWLEDGASLDTATDAVVREIARVTEADLADGTATVPVPSARDVVVQLRLDGPGRARLSLAGEPLTPWAGEEGGAQLVLAEDRDGWLANWSDGAAHWEMSPLFREVPAAEWGRAAREEVELVVEFETPGEGRLTLTVLEALVPGE